MKVNLEELAKLDVDNFTVEDTMRIYNMWRWTAKLVLKTAVRRGDFGTDGTRYWLNPKEGEDDAIL